MGGARGSGDDIDPVSWLADTAKPGDLILTGNTDRVSRLIQWGTRSHSSHVAIVSAPNQVVEAYDYGLTPEEWDEGVYRNCLSHVVDRSPTLGSLIVRRPANWASVDQERLDVALREAEENSPPFPTTGAGLTSMLVLLTHPGFRRRLAWTGPVGRWLIEFLIDLLVKTVADGPRRVHCAELATRLYTGVGIELRFRDLALGGILFELPASSASPDGHLEVDSEHRQRLSELVGPPRRACRSQLPGLDDRQRRRLALRARWRATGGVLQATVRATRRRWRESDWYEPDMADLILPADLERATPFMTIGILTWRDGRWVEERWRQVV